MKILNNQYSVGNETEVNMGRKQRGALLKAIRKAVAVFEQ